MSLDFASNLSKRIISTNLPTNHLVYVDPTTSIQDASNVSDETPSEGVMLIYNSSSKQFELIRRKSFKDLDNITDDDFFDGERPVYNSSFGEFQKLTIEEQTFDVIDGELM